MYLIRRLVRGSIRLKTINHSKKGVDMDMRTLFILWNSQSGLNPVPQRNRIAKAQFLWHTRTPRMAKRSMVTV